MWRDTNTAASTNRYSGGIYGNDRNKRRTDDGTLPHFGHARKTLVFILALVLIFMALCVVVFAGEPGAPDCDLQSGLAAAVNLSQKQCEDLRQLTDRFYNDTAVTRNKSVEKRLELRNPLKTSETEPHVINKRERELKALDQEFSRRAHQTEVDQRRLLSSDQIHKIKEMTYGYNLQRSGMRGYERQ